MPETQKPQASSSSRLINRTNCCLVVVDLQPIPFFTVGSINRQLLINNAIGLVKTAKAFDIPTILTSVMEQKIDGPFLPALKEVNGTDAIDRTGNNVWEDQRVVDAVAETGREKIIFAGLWSSNCIAISVLSALESGYDVLFVPDACGDVSKEAHEMAMMRMIQAGAQPLNWQSVGLELLRDWTDEEMAAAISQIAMEHGGAQGQSMLYHQEMVDQ